MNAKNVNYAILRLRSWYGSEDTIEVLCRKGWNHDTESHDIGYDSDVESYHELSLPLALEIVAAEDERTYYLAHNEAGRGELLIVPENVVSAITAIHDDGSSVDWSDYEGEDNDLEAIGQYINQQILAIARAGEVQL